MAIRPRLFTTVAATVLATVGALTVATSVAFATTGPAITSADHVTFTVRSAGSFTVAATGTPTPTIAESGYLPDGVTFDPATRTLTATPRNSQRGTYPITFTATNGAAAPAVQSFTLTIDQATITFPPDGQLNIDTTQPFTWTPIPEAQGYIVLIGVAEYGSNLYNSGILPPTTTGIHVSSLPGEATLWATLLTKVNGDWTSYDDISFTSAPTGAVLTYPTRQPPEGVDPTRSFTWSPYPQAQAYLLVVGTTEGGADLLRTAVLPPTQTSYAVPIFPAGKLLYATLLTKVNGLWDHSDAKSFVDRKPIGSFTFPVDGQLAVITPTTFSWTTIAGAQQYYLVIGTTLFGSNLVNSGPLAPTQSTYHIPQLPSGKGLFATLLTEVNGVWRYQAVGFHTV